MEQSDASRIDRQSQSQNQSHTSSKQFHEDESGEICGACRKVRGGSWIVQCDGCEQWYHFKCVKFDEEEVREEDPWFCGRCRETNKIAMEEIEAGNNSQELDNQGKELENQSKELEKGSTTVTSDRRSASDMEKIQPLVQSFVQWLSAQNEVNFHDSTSGQHRFSVNESNNRTKPTHGTHRNDSIQSEATENGVSQRVVATTAQVHQSQSTSVEKANPKETQPTGGEANESAGNAGRVLPIQEILSVASPSFKSVRSIKSMKSEDRMRIEQQRLQDELALQEKIDNERIALKLEALSLREAREKRFLDEKFRMMSEEVDGMSSDGESEHSKNSKVARSMKNINDTGLVLEWVENQRKLRSQINQEVPNVSIEMSQRELQTIVEKQLHRPELGIIRNGQLLQSNANHQMSSNKGAPSSNAVRSSENYGIGNPPSTKQPSLFKTGINSTLIQDHQPTTKLKDRQVTKQSNNNPIAQGHQSDAKQDHRYQPLQSHQLHGGKLANNYTNRGTVPPIHDPDPMTGQNGGMSSVVNPHIPKNGSHQSNSGKNSSNVHQGNVQMQSNEQMHNIDRREMGVQMNGQSARSYQFTTDNQILTAEQIAARHVISKKLPKFYGNPAEWPEFIQKYIRTTKKCGFDNTENLDRLEESLQGKAREIVQSQLSIPDCVPSIIATLEDKYGRKEVVVKAILEDIRAEEPIKPDKLETLSMYGYKVRNVYHTIQNQGMEFYLNDPELIQELVDKLPHQTKIDWATYSINVPQVTLATLSDWLIKLSLSLNRITMPQFSTNSKDQKKDKESTSKEVKENSSWLNRRSNSSKGAYINAHDSEDLTDSKQNQGGECEYCHSECKGLADCPEFKRISTKEKWEFVYGNKKICRGCLQIHRRRCTKLRNCGVNGCAYKHHPLLHDNEKMINSKASQSSHQTSEKDANEKEVNEKDKTNISNCNTHGGARPVLYKIIPVRIMCGDKSISTLAYMDDGSGITLIENELAEELGLKGTPQKLSLRWTSGTVRHENDSMRVVFKISGENSNECSYQLRDARTVASLDLPEQKIDKTELVKRYPYLARVPFSDFNATPRVLIGLDNIKLITSREQVEGRWSEPIASRTLLGWVVHGPNGIVSSEESQYMQHHVLSINQCPCEADRDNELHQQIETFFSLENFGTRALNNPVESKEIQRARKIMEVTTIRKKNRFETGLLWRFDNIKLPNNWTMAMKRLECQEKRMQANPALMENINNQIRNFVTKGYIRKLSPEEIHADDDRIWYLPVFHYLDPKKPEKVRLVWDAAAKYKGVSLNSMLITGPDNLVPLVDILRRFREKRIAVGGDLEEMFHQVQVIKRDQNSQRFLWRDGNRNAKPEVYVMQVLTFGTNCSPTLAQNTKNKNAKEFEKEFPQAASAIIENHYVDDWIDSQHTVEEAICLAKDVKFVHRQGGFNLRKFVSNSEEVLKALGGDNGTSTKDLSVSTTLNTQRILGMWWDSKTDCFTFSLKFTKFNEEVLLGLRAPTKREMLKTLMSIYDPMGLIAFFLVHLKILLQEVWKTKVAWDEQIPPELCERWKRWIDLLPAVENVKIPRLFSIKISPNPADLIELHTFVDASENAYCAVSYLRIIDQKGVDCVLAGAKTKVAPLKPLLTTPRMELLAAVLGTRLAKSLDDSLTLTINKRFFWSDSRDVMCWIRSTTRKYRQFVAFRIGEILETTIEPEWRWVPGKLNVADDGTKWSRIPRFDQDCRWFRGPEFLYDDKSMWPQDLPTTETTEEEIHVHLVHTKPLPPSQIVPERFSKWSSLVNTQALSTRYIEKLVAKVKGQSINGPLKTEELVKAERTLFKLAQFDCFFDEIMGLRNSKVKIGRKSGVKKSSPIYKCSPYIEEDGLLRVRGRIDKIDGVKFEMKRPIILPKNHRITELVVNNYHRMYLHRNNETVLNELKQKFHIPKVRVLLKTVIAKCQMCKNNRAKPEVPEMGDLPVARLSPGFRAFTYTGVDYFGPINVAVRRSTEKRWGVLFTCLTTRAMHIELASSLDADSCILCVRNFTNLRGTPREFHSDNGTNMTAADKELRKEFEKLDKEKIQAYYTRTYTSWSFNPPAAPHFGGAWERLIYTVKENLRSVMFTRTPKEELLRSYLWEVANIINSRPLTYVPLESIEDEVLTPNHFIFGSSNGQKAPGDFPSEEVSLTKSWRRSQELTNKFWKCWIKAYLPMLTRRSKWFSNVKPVEIGDVVLLVDEKNARNTYPRGIVVDVLPDRHGQVRQATVKFAEVIQNGQEPIEDARVRISVKTRPIAKLAVLDVKGDNEEVKSGESSTSLNGGEYVADGNNVTLKSKARNTVPLEDVETVTNDSRKNGKNHIVRRSKRIANQKIRNQN